MKPLNAPQKRAHFLGSKIRALRKRNGMTMDDLVYRCHQLNSQSAPSVPYLSLIENGRRNPSEKLLVLFSELFQKDVSWFRDDSTELLEDAKKEVGFPENKILLEPGILFSKELMERAIPELLSQASISGRQFSHVLLRAYQEQNKNKFPDLERLADETGGRKFPVDVSGLMKLCKKHGINVKWFQKPTFLTKNDAGQEIKTLFRSFYDSPRTVYINKQLENEPKRLKYELALYLAHKILHNGDGAVSSHATGGELGGSPRPSNVHVRAVTQEDILIAWRDFECSFFAGALLCPRQPFRRFLVRNGYSVHAIKKLELTPGVVMRRMTVVSPYDRWHYFDIYPPGMLRVAYRGNRIPLPWGSMQAGIPACEQWALFRAAQDSTMRKPLAQISLLKQDDLLRLYACTAVRTKDAAGNSHVVSVGVDLVPMLEFQGFDVPSILNEMDSVCLKSGQSIMPKHIASAITTAAGIQNISWVKDGLENPVVVICPRRSNCPRSTPCKGAVGSTPKNLSWVDEIKNEILIS
jgi:transcriptional regulator with XRE-family HTH domain